MPDKDRTGLLRQVVYESLFYGMDILPLLSFFFFFFFFLLLLGSMNHRNRNPKPKLPPGPWNLPILGGIHHLAGSEPSHRRLRRLAQSHNTPLLHLKLGELDFIIASTTSAAHAILKTHDLAFASRPALKAIKTIAYNCAGLGFSPHGPYWRQLRRICSLEVLSNRRVRSFSSMREEAARELVDHLRSASAVPVNLTRLFLSLTNDHVTRAAFGKVCPRKEEFLRAMKETIKRASVLSLVDLFPSMAPLIGALDGSTEGMRRLHEELDGILDEIIEEHRAQGGGHTGQKMEEDLVDVLLRVQEKEELEIPLQMVDIKAVILDMLVAATETTASTLEWVMSELVQHPRVMRATQLEIREALRGKKSIDDDVAELHQLKLVIKETLRLHPPLPLLLPRTCGDDVELLGFRVPRGSRVMVNAWAIGRDPELWKDPDSFLPERFEESAVDFKGGSLEYFPFGAGRRICPGMTFALAGMELFLAALLFHFNWEIPEGKELDMEEEYDGSLRRKNDLCLMAIPYWPLEKQNDQL